MAPANLLTSVNSLNKKISKKLLPGAIKHPATFMSRQYRLSAESHRNSSSAVINRHQKMAGIAEIQYSLKNRRAGKSTWKRSKRMLPEKLQGDAIQLCGDLPEILIEIQSACTNLVAAYSSSRIQSSLCNGAKMVNQTQK